MAAGYGDYYRAKRVMITGGLGFIGSNLARRLVALEADVLLVDSLIPQYGGNLFNISGIEDQVHVNIADVRDENGMDYLVQKQDVMFNLAGQVSHIDSMRDPYTDLEINTRAQLSILEACRKNNPAIKIVYSSTRQIYGKPDYLPVDERHLVHPTDVNGINTMAGEWYHIVYNNVYGIRATSLRLTNTYGPRMMVKTDRQTALGWFIRLAMDAQTIQIFGDGQQKRDYTYVDDVVEALLLAGANDAANGEVFNLGGLEPVSHLQLIRTLCAVAGCGGYKIVPFPPERKAIDIGDFYADHSKIQSVLGWQPLVGLSDGLTRTIDFYRANREYYWT
jgi:UDP-glucose 4-epimerase